MHNAKEMDFQMQLVQEMVRRMKELLLATATAAERRTKNRKLLTIEGWPTNAPL
jgi:negative regulator of replication initiation